MLSPRLMTRRNSVSAASAPVMRRLLTETVMDDVKATVKSIYHKSKFLKSTTEVPAGEPFGILLDKTNFYAEQGGQEYDTGVLAIDGKAEFKVHDVQVANGYVLHIGQMEEGDFAVGDELVATYDEVSYFNCDQPDEDEADKCSFVDGPSATTTPGPTFSTSLFEKSSETTSTRRVPSLLLTDCDSTSRTTSRSPRMTSARSRTSVTSGSRRLRLFTRRRCL